MIDMEGTLRLTHLKFWVEQTRLWRILRFLKTLAEAELGPRGPK